MNKDAIPDTYLSCWDERSCKIEILSETCNNLTEKERGTVNSLIDNSIIVINSGGKS